MNDAAAMYHDVLAYDDAMQAVLDFAGKNKNTMVVASSDHETGGMIKK